MAALSGGSGKASSLHQRKWQFYANTLVQLPWSVDLSGAAFGKQGGLYPQNLRLAAGRDGTVNARPARRSTHRYDNVWNVDLRLAKTCTSARRTSRWRRVFNVANSGQVPVRSRQANGAGLQPDRRGAEPQHLPSRRDLRLLAEIVAFVSTAPGATPGPFLRRVRSRALSR